jgi:hypothetical protein
MYKKTSEVEMLEKEITVRKNGDKNYVNIPASDIIYLSKYGTCTTEEYCNKNNIKLIIECEICGCEGASYIEDFGESFCEDCEPTCIYCFSKIDECLCNSDNTERFE